MRLKEYLLELAMSKDTKIEIESDNANEYFAYIFLPDGTRFHVMTDGHPLPVSELKDIIGQGIEKLNFTTNKIKLWHIDFADEHGSMSKDPKSSKIALQLFAALETYFKDFITKKKPDVFNFAGTGASRKKLYNTLSKKIEKNSNYKYLPMKGLYYFVRKDLIK
jgi:hypothetical protein